MKPRNTPSAEQREQFGRHVEEFQNLLNLRDWRIEPGGKPARKGAMAEVTISPQDRLAVWHLGHDWGNCLVTDKALRETALHEVLHIFLRPLMDACASRDESAVDALEHSAIVVLEKLLAR